MSHRHENMNPEVASHEILMTRIVDGEAGTDDLARFELAAAADPGLWRRLAIRLRDMRSLEAEFDDEVATALTVELPAVPITVPAPGHAPPARPAGRFAWTAATLGWAAVLVVGMAWAVSTMLGTPPAPASRDVAGTPAGGLLTPEQHLELYMQSPHVLGQLAPVLQEVQDLPDGRLGVSYLRRIVEVKIIEAGERLDGDELDPFDLPGEAEPDRSGSSG